jgi:hypothetical protein
MQLAEINQTGDPNVLMRLNVNKDILEEVTKSKTILERIRLYTGMTDTEIDIDIKEKIRILKWMVKKEIYDVNRIGYIVAKYYMGTLQIED